MSESSPASPSGAKPATERSITAAMDRPERRGHPRFKVEGGSVTLGKPGLLSILGLGRRPGLVNLSQSGLMISAGKAIPVGTRLPVRLEISKYKEIIQGQVEIRWCAQSAKNEAEFYLGLFFIEIDALERKKIGRMQELFSSAEYRALSSARKDASSGRLKAQKS